MRKLDFLLGSPSFGSVRMKRAQKTYSWMWDEMNGFIILNLIDSALVRPGSALLVTTVVLCGTLAKKQLQFYFIIQFVHRLSRLCNFLISITSPRRQCQFRCTQLARLTTRRLYYGGWLVDAVVGWWCSREEINLSSIYGYIQPRQTFIQMYVMLCVCINGNQLSSPLICSHTLLSRRRRLHMNRYNIKRRKYLVDRVQFIQVGLGLWTKIRGLLSI